MRITTKINKEMELHQSKTGMKCWAIYLGRNEMKELIDWGNENKNEFDPDDLEGRKRPQYNGAMVYMVNDDTHINVG